MSAHTVDLLLDERARLISKNAATESHLWAAEFILHRVSKLLPRLIAERPTDATARDALTDELREFLTEPRPHPAAGVVDDAHWPTTPSVGAGEAPTEGTT